MPKRKKTNYKKKGNGYSKGMSHIAVPNIVNGGTKANITAYETYGLAYPVDSNEAAAGWRVFSRIEKTDVFKKFVGNMAYQDAARVNMMKAKGTSYFNRFALKIQLSDDLKTSTTQDWTNVILDKNVSDINFAMRSLISSEADLWGVPYKAIADALMSYVKYTESPALQEETYRYFAKKIGASDISTLSKTPPNHDIYKSPKQRVKRRRQ